MSSTPDNPDIDYKLDVLKVRVICLTLQLWGLPTALYLNKACTRKRGVSNLNQCHPGQSPDQHFSSSTIKTKPKNVLKLLFLETLDTILHHYRHLELTTSVSSLYFSKLLSTSTRVVLPYSSNLFSISAKLIEKQNISNVEVTNLRRGCLFYVL